MKIKNKNMMRSCSKTYAKFLAGTLAVVLLVSGSISGLHASVTLNHSEDCFALASAEIIDEADIGYAGGHNHPHHPDGEQECHSVSCNLFSPAAASLLSAPSYQGIVFAVSTKQRAHTLFASLYRPPKSVL